MTPVSPEPICDASRMRCDSPPESVSAERSRREIVETDVVENASRLTISDDPVGDRSLVAVEDHPFEVGGGGPQRHLRHLEDRSRVVARADLDEPRLAPQPRRRTRDRASS
jgi:hypothetical protein